MHAIARFYNTAGTPVGAGFLVPGDCVMTCAHVVNSALGRDRAASDLPPDPVALDFPLLGDISPLTAQVAVWRPMSEGDIAVLRLDASLTLGARCAEPGSTHGNLWGAEVRTFGFPAGYPGGTYAEGELRDRQADGWLQVDAAPDSQYFVEAGFSGAPAWDADGRVLGMVVTKDATPGKRVAYLIPAETLADAYPPLRTASPAPADSHSAPRHVFISYSRKDTEFVERLERDLNARGIVTWRDTSSIVGGEEWYKAIVRGIHAAYVMVQVCTLASDQSKWVRREALYADQQDLPVIPVMPALHDVPFHLIDTQPVRFDDPTYESGLARLLAALGRVRDSRPAVATPAPDLGPTDRATEIAYLDFLLGELKADLRTARYVNLGATRERSTVLRAAAGDDLDEFTLSFERFEPLVKAECIRGEDLNRADAPEPDARVPLREMPRAILLGEPGSGKTTTLQQLAVDLAREAKNALETDTPGDPPPLPVFVRLSGYDGAQPFDAFVAGHLGPLQSQYARLRDAGRLVLLLDALNEMPRTGSGRALVEDVRGFLSARGRWVVSCRARDYQEELKDLPEVGRVRLCPLDLPRIRDVIDRRFATGPEQAAALWADLKGSDDLLAMWRRFENAGQAEAFWGREPIVRLVASWNDAPSEAWEAMRDDPRRMMMLCRNPFMLFMVCRTFEELHHLPTNRGALFAQFVDNLLLREEQASRRTGRDWLSRPVITQALVQLAYAMQVSETGTEITRAEAERILNALPDISDPALLLRLAASASLLDVGERVHYTHQLLQEYFASQVMRATLEAGQPATEFWPPDAWWEPQGWEETAIILAGACDDPAQVREWAERVARWIAPAQPEVAYQALTESGVEVDLDTLQAETRAALVDSAAVKKEEPNPVGRAAAYRVLGVFDADERPGIRLRTDGIPDLDWVKVPAGKFVYQKDQRLTLPTFYISRYPITYRQFQAFIDAPDGFHNSQWWEGLAADDDHKRSPGEQAFKYWNHPRESVSWYDAVAFCRWLSSKLDYEVRLPTEQEWEKAARGTDGRELPWGKKYISGYANIDEIGRFSPFGVRVGEHSIGLTTAVGIYPQGASPYGVLDLLGNVWEWCINEYIVGEGTRELRGCGWYGGERYARAADRVRNLPLNRLSVNGFRCVCSAPMP